MTPQDYHTVFRLGLVSFPWSAFGHSSMLIAIGLLVIRFTKTERFKIMGGVVVCLGLGTAGLLSISVVPHYLRVRNEYAAGHSTVIEGSVRDFRPMPARASATESFSVGDVTLSYDGMEDTACFNNRPPFRGLIYQGLNVRISYNEGCIQQIDVLR